MKSTETTVYTDYGPRPVSVIPGLKQVTGAKAVPYNATTVKLTWKPVSYMTNYEIWSCSSEGYVQEKLGTTVNTYYYAKNLEPNAAYYFKVRAYRTGNHYGEYSELLTAALPDFNSPENVKAEPYDITTVKVSWSKVWGAAGYEAHRYNPETGEYVKIKTTTSTYYLDKYHKLRDMFSYKVLAYSGEEKTELSDAITAGPGLRQVTGAKVYRYGLMSVKIYWNYVPYRTGYEIWRSDTEDGEYEKIGTTANTYYYDNWGEMGKTYYYKISAYRISGDTKYYGDFSSIVNATS